MSNKTITLTLVGLVILIFFSYFMLQNAVFDTGMLVTNLLNEIAQTAQQENWEKAAQLDNQLEQVWAKYKFIITLNFAEEDYSTFGNSLTSIKAAIITKDASLAVSEVLTAKEMWNNLIKVVPEP